jgi:hypothetical protein
MLENALDRQSEQQVRQERKGVAHLEGSGQEAQFPIRLVLRCWGGMWGGGIALLALRMRDSIASRLSSSAVSALS